MMKAASIYLEAVRQRILNGALDCCRTATALSPMQAVLERFVSFFILPDVEYIWIRHGSTKAIHHVV